MKSSPDISDLTSVVEYWTGYIESYRHMHLVHSRLLLQNFRNHSVWFDSSNVVYVYCPRLHIKSVIVWERVKVYSTHDCLFCYCMWSRVSLKHHITDYTRHHTPTWALAHTLRHYIYIQEVGMQPCLLLSRHILISTAAIGNKRFLHPMGRHWTSWPLMSQT